MRLLVSLILACALVTPAAADGVYFSQSFGGADVKDELGERIDGAGRFRAALGVRHRSWAVELWGGVTLGIGHAEQVASPCGDCVARTADPYPDTHAHQGSILGAYGLDLKYLQPLARHVDVYLRGGASAMGGGVQGDSYAGRGLGVGAGVQLKGKVRALGFLWWPLFFTGVGPKVSAALWADAGYDFYRLHGTDGARTLDGALTTMSFGFSVGTDL